MPNDPGASTWAAAQYQKFLEGVDQVGTVDAPRVARAARAVSVDRPKEPTINIPAWNDIVRTGPRTTITDDDWRIQKHFERAGLPSPLAPDVQDAIRDRRDVAERIRNSATPEYIQGVSTMLTAVDNVQDAALTASVAGRVLLPVLGAIGPYLAPAVLALAHIATFLNWIGLGVGLFGVGYALACQGPKAAIAQASIPRLAGYLFKGVRGVLPRSRGVPTPTPSGAHKGRVAAALYGTASGRALSNVRASRWARMRISFGEALQAAQVASDLTGYGISLGAVMGFVSETVYGAQRASQGESVRVRSPEVNHAFARVLAPHIQHLGRAASWHREQCARALASAPLILRDPETWGDTMYGLTWVVVYTAVEPLMWDTQGVHWRELVIDHLPGAWTPWEVRDATTRGILREQGTDPDAPGVWPLPGTPRELSTEQLILEIGPEVARALDRWTLAAPTDPWRRFVAEMAMHVTDRLWWWLEGSAHFPKWQLSPAAAVVESLLKASRWPIVSDPPEAIAAAWRATEQHITNTERKWVDPDELDRIWEANGSPLLRLLDSEHEWPPEHFVPFDQTTSDTSDVAYGQSIDEARRRLTKPPDDKPA